MNRRFSQTISYQSRHTFPYSGTKLIYRHAPSDKQGGPISSLEPSVRSNPAHRAHQQTKVQTACMNQQSLQNVVVAAQVDTSHSPGFIQVRHHSFEFLAALSLQPLAALALQPPPIAVDRGLFRRLPVPSLPAAFRFRDISSNARFSNPPHYAATVIPLVGHQLRRAVRFHHRRANLFVC